MLILMTKLMTYVHKIFEKTNISYPLIHTRTCAYQGVRNVSFSENFAHVLNGWPLTYFFKKTFCRPKRKQQQCWATERNFPKNVFVHKWKEAKRITLNKTLTLIFDPYCKASFVSSCDFLNRTLWKCHWHLRW